MHKIILKIYTKLRNYQNNIMYYFVDIYVICVLHKYTIINRLFNYVYMTYKKNSKLTLSYLKLKRVIHFTIKYDNYCHNFYWQNFSHTLPTCLIVKNIALL